MIADDHPVVRSGLQLLLEAEDGLAVVAEAGEIDTAKRMVAAHRPDVLVLDLNMPGAPSLPAIPELAQQTAVVVLTMQNDPAFARGALQAGALGYVLKEAADAELVGAVRAAAEGRTYLNPGLGARMAAAPPEPDGPPDDLTERELEILRLIALGHTNAEIGGQLYLQRAHDRVPPRAHPAEDAAQHARRARPLRARPRAARPTERVRAGTSAAIAVPAPDVSISSSPPISAARSRMPASPKPSVGSAASKPRAVVGHAHAQPIRVLLDRDVDARGARRAWRRWSAPPARAGRPPS